MGLLFCLENKLKHERMGCLVLPQRFGFSPQMFLFKNEGSIPLQPQTFNPNHFSFFIIAT